MNSDQLSLEGYESKMAQDAKVPARVDIIIDALLQEDRLIQFPVSGASNLVLGPPRPRGHCQEDAGLSLYYLLSALL